MNFKSFLKESDKLTEYAKNIFGDIVNKVYLAVDIFDTSVSVISENQVIEDLAYNLKNTELDSDENTIAIDATNIVIEFTNGKSVSMYTSELGSIESYQKNAKYIG